MRPKSPHSNGQTTEEGAVAAAFRRHTFLPPDDCPYGLQASITRLTRSFSHRLFQRRDISGLPTIEGDRAGRKTFNAYPIGKFHIDIAEVRTEQRKLLTPAAVDRTIPQLPRYRAIMSTREKRSNSDEQNES